MIARKYDGSYSRSADHLNHQQQQPRHGSASYDYKLRRIDASGLLVVIISHHTTLSDAVHAMREYLRQDPDQIYEIMHGEARVYVNDGPAKYNPGSWRN